MEPPGERTEGPQSGARIDISHGAGRQAGLQKEPHHSNAALMVIDQWSARVTKNIERCDVNKFIV